MPRSSTPTPAPDITRPPRFNATAATKRRREQRAAIFPDERAWEGPTETGFFCAPRTLPYILQVLRQKNVSNGKDPGPVYVELLSRHFGDGIIELTHVEDHVVGAGYTSPRTWRERMVLLERAGFIRVYKKAGRYHRVLLVHPTQAMAGLYSDGKINDRIWMPYRERQVEAKEQSVGVLNNASAPGV